jgi:hypothetical protein
MTTISGYGLTIEALPGWYGEIYRTVDGLSDTGPILHLANTPVVLADRQGYAPMAREAMRSGDAILCILNLPSLPSIVTAEGVARLGESEGWSLDGASTVPFTGVPNGQSSLRKRVQVGERSFDLVVFFSTPEPSSDIVGELNTMLRTIKVDRRPSRFEKDVEQYFNVASAIRINEETRRKMWERDRVHATPEEIAEHERLFPAG